MTGQIVPMYHLRPPRGWINDPNGMVFHDGRWHVFYQHNPAGPVHEAIAWGHASSDDLVVWRDHGVAFGPTPDGPDSHGCWSGVAVTGLDRPAVVYSGVRDASAQSTVVLRWGSDDLDTWSDPVVVATTPPDAGIQVMRDPFVFTWRGRRWALLGAGAEDGTACVLVYDCDDILTWHYRGRFVDGGDPVLAGTVIANIYECPQLVLPGGDEPGLLVLSVWLANVLGDVVGVTGTLTDGGGYPVFQPTRVHALDTGNAFYAPQVALDPSGADPLMLGWIREAPRVADPGNPDNSHEVAGCLTLPRRVSVHDGCATIGLDAGVRDLPLGAPLLLAAGEHTLPLHARVGVGAGAARLTGTGPDAEVRHDLPAGATVYLDAGVAEVIAPGVVPASYRGEPGSWRLDLAPGTEAEVRPIIAEGLLSDAG